MFTSEFCRLSFSGVADRLVLVIAVNGFPVFENRYVPDSAGKVTVYDLDRLLESCLTDSYVNVYIFANGTQLGRVSLFRCAASVAEPAQTFVPDFFLTPHTGTRDTAADRFETLTLFSAAEEAVTARCAYVKDDLSVVEKTVAVGSVVGWSALDVSARRFLDPASGRLVGYRVLCGKRKASYRVLAYTPKADPAVIFRNCFNAWETFYFTGKKETSAAYTRSQAHVGGMLRNYHIDETVSYRAMTGPLLHGMEVVALDLARAREVFLLNPDGSAGDEITVTDCDIKHSNEDDGIPDLTFTYRLADRRNSRVAVTRPLRVFDNTFDDTYE